MSMKNKNEILKSYFEDNSLVQSQIDSYNYFIREGIKKIVLGFNRSQIPDYLLELYDEIDMRIVDTWLGEAQYIEADGSKVQITPQIARQRGLTYAAPLFLKLSLTHNGKEEEFEVQIAKMPIMLKSEKCILKSKSYEELIELGEDPYEPGGYFIVNGTEKVVVMIEDLALSKFFIEEDTLKDVSGKMFSQRGVYKSLQEIKKDKNGSFTYSFGNFKNIPIFLLVKSLGIRNDKEIIETLKVTESDILFQLSEFSALSDEEEINDVIAKHFGLIGAVKEKGQRIDFYLDNFVLPHLGILKENRENKARLILKLLKRYYDKITSHKITFDDKDHYANKRVKLVGQLFEQMFIGSFNDLVVDILMSFQRTVKRDKYHSMKIIIKEQLLTQKINSALAMGVWSDGRKGVSQYLKRENYFDMLSHITRVVSPLSTSQENFLARELHSTHYGRLCPIETPEGHSIGLRKNLALMTRITYQDNPNEEKTKEVLESFGLEFKDLKFDVIFANKYIGSVNNAESFLKNFKESRKNGKIHKDYNIRFDKAENLIWIDGDGGRVRRPVFVVESGECKFTKEISDKLSKREINFEYLVDNGIIEYIDALEEDDSLIANSFDEITIEHTHVEVLPYIFLGFNTATVPFLANAEPGRLLRGQKTIKQAVGMYALNYHQRNETDRNTLVNPQVPLVKTSVYDVLKLDSHPAGQNMTVAIMSYEGYNMEDGIILNKASLERGMQRSFFYKKYTTEEIKYPGGLSDKICFPNPDIKGYRLEEDYRFLDTDGIVKYGSFVNTGDVLIGKTSPPRFNEEISGIGQMINLDIDSSITLREDEKGRVSKILLIENETGFREVQVILRDHRLPIVGDKFASRHGQKGVVGGVLKQSDMPSTEKGVVPDLIFSPHSIPGRKTVSHLVEVLAGKVAALRGEFVDGTGFCGESEEDLRDELKKLGFDSRGVEVMHDPKTGKKIKAQIYVGSIYYLRLKHQVDNKIQARGTGPVQLLTRQPAEGRARGGGLKLGEMEKDTIISHGASLLLKERFSSDQTTALVCLNCGHLADPYLFNYKSKCPVCNSSKFDKIELSYAFKLFANELRSLSVDLRFKTKDRFFEETQEETKVSSEEEK